MKKDGHMDIWIYLQLQGETSAGHTKVIKEPGTALKSQAFY